MSRDQRRLWIGTPGGFATYDGLQARPPAFEPVSDARALYVNSIIELDDGSVLVGTINDSVWHWSGSTIRKVLDGETRNEWAFARADDGRIFAATSFGRPIASEQMQALREATKATIVPVAGGASYLQFVAGDLVTVTNSGTVTTLDGRSGNRVAAGRLPLSSQSFVRSVHADRSNFFVGTDEGCFTVDPRAPSLARRITSGNCRAAFRQKSGVTWASRDGTYRHDLHGWRQWWTSEGEIGAATTFAEDGNGNVWVGTVGGLWRYLDVVQDAALPLSGGVTIARMIGDGEGGVIVGLSNGQAWKVSASLRSEQLPVPYDGPKPASSYYAGALPGRDKNGRLWILNHRGLFRIEGNHAEPVAPYPVAFSERSLAPASLAVWDESNVYVGFLWSAAIARLQNGSWSMALALQSDPSGSAVPQVTIDQSGTLWAVGSQTLLRRSLNAAPQEIGPFTRAPFGKKHLFGAISLEPSTEHSAVASGGWGGVVFVTPSAPGHFQVTARDGSDRFDQPYLIRDLAHHPLLGLLAATETGLYRWEGSASQGAWRSLRAIDPRLDLPATGVVPSTGRAVWIASRAGLSLLRLPDTPPTVGIRRTPAESEISRRTVTLEIVSPGLTGLPSHKRIEVSVEPPVAGAVTEHSGPRARVDLAELTDGARYRVTARVIDGFENSGEAAITTFLVALPFYQNPLKTAVAAVLALGLIGLAVTRRGPTGFVLRRLAGKRWSVATTPPRLRLEVSPEGSNIVRFEMDAPGEPTTVRFVSGEPRAPIDKLARRALASLAGIPLRQTGIALAKTFDHQVEKIGLRVSSVALPEGAQFAAAQVSEGTLQLVLDDSMLNLPWELATWEGRAALGLTYGIARHVNSDRLSSRKGLRVDRLRVVVFAPSYDAATASLPRSLDEVAAVSRRAAAWGAEVVVLSPTANKRTVLEAMCSAHLFHYAGHAEFDPNQPEASFLPIAGDRIDAEDIASALAQNETQLLLAFINGCGSSREADWRRGEAVFGLASAFVRHATYFVGAQWPIQDTFAAQFAEVFYKSLFPATDLLWWRWLRREPLDGTAFAEALRSARAALKHEGTASAPTWPAYVYYGDATSRLVLQ
ncbi:MAG TPA: CHAT domain-containing protein [Microvirga sp.]|nr:CHAT domain-containing protein [Microvirga sp.]